MRIACLVTVCGLLPIITSIDAEEIHGLNASNFEDVFAGSKFLSSHNSSTSPNQIHSETEIDVHRTTRNVREPSPTPYNLQPSNRRVFSKARSPKRGGLKRSGSSVGVNDIHGDENIPLRDSEESEEIHIEPIPQLTKKSAIESIVDLIRSVIEPTKNQLGPLIGPVRFPGVGKKVYIRLPEPVENESNHVVVRLLSRPVVHSSSGHSLLPAEEPSAQSSNHHRSTHLPPSTTIATNRHHHGLRHRYLQSTALPEHSDISDNELDSHGVSSDKDRVAISSPITLQQQRQDSSRSSFSLNNRQPLIADQKSPGRSQRYDDIDNTSRMSRVHPMSDRLKNPYYSLPRNTRRYNGQRFFNNVNQQWNVRGRGNVQQQWSVPIRERQLMSRSYSGSGKYVPRNHIGRGYFTPNMKSGPRFSPVLKYSPLDGKDGSNEWRGIAGNYRNELGPSTRQQLYVPVNDFKYSDASTSSSTNPITKFHWQTPQKNLTTGFSSNQESALNIITAPPLQYFRPYRNITNSAMNFSRNVLNELPVAKKLNDEDKTPANFLISVLPNTNKLVIKPESNEFKARKTHILRIVPKSLKLKSRINAEKSQDASKYESLESVLRFDDIKNISSPTDSKSAKVLDGPEETSGSDELEEEYDESDDSSVHESISNESQESLNDYNSPDPKMMSSELDADELEESFENSNTSSTERIKTSYKSIAEPTKNPKTHLTSSRTSKNDVLFNIMSMTASQLWNEQPNNSKSKSVLGILKIRNGGKNVIAKVPGTPEKPRNHQLLEFPSSDEDETVEYSNETTESHSSENIEKYKCGNPDISEEAAFVNSCEYDTDSDPEVSAESYEEK